MKKLLSISLAFILVFTAVFASGCGKRQTDPQGSPEKHDNGKKPGGDVSPAVTSSFDLMEGITASEDIFFAKADPASLKKALSFSARLYEKCYASGDNTLISPLSVLIALSMTANGADNNTLAQMEETFGLKLDDLNALLGSLIAELAKDESCLKSANAIWFKDRDLFSPKADFLQKNADIYKASLYKAPFDDSTVRDINGWVDNHTNGMISELLDTIPPEALMYLVNALVFEAKWQAGYNQHQIAPEDFYNASGSKKNVPFLSSRENTYIVTENATGFAKPYEDERYSFIALLPNEGKTVDDVVSSLSRTLESLSEFNNESSVDVMIPKFELDYDKELTEVLMSMGITDAFCEKADFGKMCTCDGLDGTVHISGVIHKTHIEVDEEGTRAAAVTGVEVGTTSLQFTYEVILNRPFVFMIYDNLTEMPVFVGNVSEL